MPTYTLHNKSGDYLSFKTTSFEKAKKECDNTEIPAKICETYFEKCPFDPTKITEHGKEVYMNF